MNKQALSFLSPNEKSLMQLIRMACLVLVAASLIGCAAPALQGARPASALNQQYGLAKSEVLARTDHTTQHLDDAKSILYFQNQGGGGAALGLLLGPFGVAANIEMIKGVTTADVEKLKGKLHLNPDAALQQAAAATSLALQAAASQGDVKVTPFIFVSKTNETDIHLSSVVLFEGEDGQKKWLRRYQYQLPGKYTLDELSSLSEAQTSGVQAASTLAYGALLKYIAAEQDAAIAQEKKITLTSAYLTPRFEMALPGSLIGEQEGRVWVRTMFGVYAVAPADIQIVKN
ncbi:hypothetical protein [Andreprevotia lacus]|nr:hypothetical protein [Andreprevotia lacus]